MNLAAHPTQPRGQVQWGGQCKSQAEGFEQRFLFNVWPCHVLTRMAYPGVHTRTFVFLTGFLPFENGIDKWVLWWRKAGKNRSLHRVKPTDFAMCRRCFSSRDAR